VERQWRLAGNHPPFLRESLWRRGAGKNFQVAGTSSPVTVEEGVCYLKGKLFVGTVGIFVPPVAFVGAVRLGKPGSPWARWRYGARPAKLERARRRDEGFHQLWERRKNRLWDVIGGKPHHVLSSCDGAQRSHDALLSGGAAEDPGGPRV